jgi:glycosyltransferase involved in cell wall biosynthesis
MKFLFTYFKKFRANKEKNILNKKANVLYLTRNGLLEPLGQSQVMTYLRGLSEHYCITLISHEKPEDLSNNELMDQAYTNCLKYGICWLPQKFQPHPRIIAPAISILKMIWLVKKEVNRKGVHLIHARSYLPAFVALIINSLTSIPFIFDMRALWPEELITAGKIKRGSLLYRAIVRAERSILARSAAVVSLTNVAVNYLKSKYLVELKNQRIVVIPTCVDLEKFTPHIKNYHNPKIYGCIGTILSGWFRIDLLSSWIRVVALHDPKSRFEILTRDDATKVRKILDPANEFIERLSIKSVLSEGVPDAIRVHGISLMFFTEGLGKLGSAPTRLAEALGSGIPIVANKGVGDVEDIIKKNNIGVIVEGDSKKQMEEAFQRLQVLLQDPELSNRCFNTAKSIFSLDKGTEMYHKIYKAILNKKNISCVD